MPQGNAHSSAAAHQRRGRGFRRVSKLVSSDIRKGTESRGFAVSKLLTRWEEIAGAEIAHQARPVDVKYGREGLGATLSLLCPGAVAPMIEMQSERLRERVNACYGYSAISRIRITQTAPTGFAEPAPEYAAPLPQADPKAERAAEKAAAAVDNEGLRQALSDLGKKILSKHKT